MSRARLAALTALALLAACGDAAPEGEQLRVTVLGESDMPGPLATRLADQVTVQTLITRDGNGELVGGLASSWRFVDDGRSLILRLRPTRWSDGKALVSEDVVAAFRREARRGALLRTAGIDNAAAVAARRLPEARLGVLAPIARVVELRLEAASPLLLGWLAEPGLAITRPGKPTLTRYARALEKTDASQQITLTRIAREQSDEARPAEIRIGASSDAAAAVAAFGRGETDILIGEGLAGLSEARLSARREVLRLDPLWGVYGYLANGLKGPLASPDVRRALALAVDRPALTARYGIPAMAPVAGLLPPALRPQPLEAVAGEAGEAEPPPPRGVAAGLRRAIGGQDAAADVPLEEARALLAKAGYTAETPLRLTLLLPPGREHRSIAERVGADWARIGVTLVVSEAAAPARARLIARGNFDLAVSEASVPVPDAGALLARYRCGAGPHCNAAADALLDAAALAGPAERERLLAEAEQALLAGPPLIGLFAPVRWALVAPQVDGWMPNVAASHPLNRLVRDPKKRR